ncbi:MAG TPA: type II toxin-antitoxin system RelE/ParE family toxin [Burkholderiales bacterium]|nr:type II toxin-antitoxin system RelE/ParE family toxin [Burkholderiales bacterium]
MIRSFKDADSERLFNGQYSRRLPQDLQRTAARKLAMLDAAPSLRALSIPPANRLEKLRGDRAGSYSIRINRQWRICFSWHDADAHDVEIVDYHD